MKQSPESVEAAIAFVAAADPLPQRESDRVDTEAQLRILLANLPESPTSQPRSTHPRATRARLLRIGAVGVGAAAATAVAVNVIGSGSPNGTGGFLSQARAAELISRVEHRLSTYAPGGVLEVLTSQHETSPGRSLWSTDNTWQSTTAPYNDREQRSGGGAPAYEQGLSPQGIPQLYDPAHNTIYEPFSAYDLTAGPRAGTRTLTVPRAEAMADGVTLPAGERGTTQLTITSAQARGLRSGAFELAYRNAIVTKRPGFYRTHRFYILTTPQVIAGHNVAPSTFENWARRLESHGTRVRLDGHSAIEIDFPSERTTYWFSARTLLPIKAFSQITVDHNGSPDQGFSSSTTYYHAYRVLRGAGAQRLLSVGAAHPNAKVVVGQPSFEVNSERLG